MSQNCPASVELPLETPNPLLTVSRRLQKACVAVAGFTGTFAAIPPLWSAHSCIPAVAMAKITSFFGKTKRTADDSAAAPQGSKSARAANEGKIQLAAPDAAWAACHSM
jgi:hypothetical protein